MTNLELLLNEFNEEKNGSLRRSRTYREKNREKINSHSREVYHSNIQRERKRHRDYHSRNRKDQLKKKREFYEENKESESNKRRIYKKINPDVMSLSSGRRRARKAGNGGSHTIDQRREKFTLLGDVCYYCGIPGKMTVDHLIPISRGGTDDIENIVPACLLCNARKNNKTAEEFFEIINTSKEIAFNQARVAEYRLTH